MIKKKKHSGTKFGQRLIAAEAMPITPNSETIAAIEAARRGELSGPFHSTEELFNHLHEGIDID